MILERIKENLPAMPPLYRRVAQYILDNSQNVGFLSIYEVSEATKISNATLVRFSRSLGMKGYSELRHLLQEEIANRISSYEKIATSGLSGLTRNQQRLKFFQNEQENLRRTFENFDTDTLDKIVATIEKAERIFLAGFGLTRFFIGSFEYALRATTDKLVIPLYGCVSDYSPALKSLEPGDCLFLTTFPPYSGEGAHIGSFVKDQGGTFILLTDSAACPMYPYADLVVRCERNSLLLQNSYVGLVAVLQTIVNQVSLVMKDTSARERKAAVDVEKRGYAILGGVANNR